MHKEEFTRPEFQQIADTIMAYCVRELGSDKMTMLPFVTNVTQELTPVILRLFERKATDATQASKTVGEHEAAPKASPGLKKENQ